MTSILVCAEYSISDIQLENYRKELARSLDCAKEKAAHVAGKLVELDAEIARRNGGLRK